MKYTLENKGFTLIELAIVIVIIGLLVGGVLTGQSLIDAAKVNRVISDVNKYNAAMLMFKSKYNAEPGDMRNAYDFFDGSGGSSVCGPNTTNTPTSCNGSGNNLIAPTFGSLEEAGRLWQHLSLAKLIPTIQYYTGKLYYQTLKTVEDISPRSTLADGAMFTVYSPRFEASYWNPPIFYGQSALWIMLSKPTALGSTGGGSDYANTPYERTSWIPPAAATPIEAYSIDKKMDDGLPTTGTVIASSTWAVNQMFRSCTSSVVITPGGMGTTSPSNSIEYQFVVTGADLGERLCNLYFKTGLE